MKVIAKIRRGMETGGLSLYIDDVYLGFLSFSPDKLVIIPEATEEKKTLIITNSFAITVDEYQFFDELVSTYFKEEKLNEQV